MSGNLIVLECKDMEKFLQIAKSMESMNKEELAKSLEAKKSMCICGNCPSYDECTKNKEELLFCAIGKSECMIAMKGCVCPSCPVTSDMGLTHSYFCTRGSEKQQRGM
jgi:uncharacterized Rossmann fold enzyme